MSHKRFNKHIKVYIKELKKTLAIMDEGEVTIPDPGLRIRNALTKRGFEVWHTNTGPFCANNKVTISYK